MSDQYDNSDYDNSDYDDRDYLDPAEYYDGPTRAEAGEAIRSMIESRDRREREAAAEPHLEQYFVWWDSITAALATEFRHRLDAATREQDMQEYLAANPILLVQALSGGHGRWVVPQKRLGCEFVPDFMLAGRDSLGFNWTAVELESPLAKWTTKAGELTSTANHAVRQIEDWRGWLRDNRDYAVRPASQTGLNLVDIDQNVPGWVILGRRGDVDGSARRRRARGRALGIELHTYDWLVEQAEMRAHTLSGRRRSE